MPWTRSPRIRSPAEVSCHLLPGVALCTPPHPLRAHSCPSFSGDTLPSLALGQLLVLLLYVTMASLRGTACSVAAGTPTLTSQDEADRHESGLSCLQASGGPWSNHLCFDVSPQQSQPFCLGSLRYVTLQAHNPTRSHRVSVSVVGGLHAVPLDSGAQPLHTSFLPGRWTFHPSRGESVWAWEA